MSNDRKTLAFFTAMLLFTTAVSTTGKKRDKSAEITQAAPELWQVPSDITARNLMYGPGSEQDRPHPPFTFLKEDLSGSNPKFDVRDRDGVKWRVKLGAEAKPETVASRLVWAVGYYANEDYFLPELRVDKMPRLQRKHAEKFIQPDGSMLNVRLKRHLTNEKKIGTWKWRDNPFSGTRELNGLRVMMALINNWDLKDQNNSVYSEKHTAKGGPEQIYMVSDLGASFGTTHLVRGHEKAKGNLESYVHSRFIRDVKDGFVNFEDPHRPAVIVLVNPHEFFSRLNLEWIGRDIPVDDVRWMGQILSQLSDQQIRDAFRAAGYTPEDVDAFASEVESRIGELKNL